MDYENNPYYLRPGESISDYNARVQSQYSTNQPVGDIFNVIGGEQSRSDRMAEDQYRESQRYSTDPEYYRQKFIGMFQDRINALNQVYDQQLAKAQHEGKGRIGQGTAVLARRGLAGSPRGGAIQEGVLDVNRQVEGSIQAQRNAEIGAIMGTVSQMAVEEARAKATAKAEGAASYLEHLKTQETRKEGYVEQNVQAALAQGLDINNVADTIAEKLGVSKEKVLLKYSEAVAAKEAAAYEKEGVELSRSKTKAEIAKINDDIAKGDFTTTDLGNQVAVFDKNTGKIVSYLPKGAVPKESDATSPAGIDPLKQIEFLKKTIGNAKDLSKASGASGISKVLGDTFKGDSKFRQLEAYTNTLKTNLLTLAVDPSVKKFFGPQMSNADVELMMSGGTTLNPQKNSPKQMSDELDRVLDLFDRMEKALGGESGSGDGSTYEDYLNSI